MDNPWPDVFEQPLAEEGLALLLEASGLVYHDHVQRQGRRPDGAPGLVWVPTERPMTPADVLSQRCADGRLFVVTADGQKWEFTAAGDARCVMGG